MKYLFIISSIFIISCTQDSEVVDLVYSFPSEHDLVSTISYDIIHPDTLVIFSNQKPIFNDRSIKYIIHLKKDLFGQVIGYDSISVNYQQDDDKQVMLFFHKIADRNKAIYPLQLQFHINEKEFKSITINIEMYKYPFKSAKTLFNRDSLTTCSDIYEPRLNSFDFWDADIVFHPTGSDAFYKVNLKNLSCEMIYPVVLGVDFVIVDYPYLYVDYGEEIDKFDLRTQMSELKLGLGYIDTNLGMDIKDEILYVMHDKVPNNKLSTFNLNGKHLSTIAFDYPCYSLTIDGDYLYTLGQTSEHSPIPDKIIRYNIITQTYEKTEILDIGNWMAIQIRDENIYYIEFYKNIICYIPLNELNFY